MLPHSMAGVRARGNFKHVRLSAAHISAEKSKRRLISAQRDPFGRSLVNMILGMFRGRK